MNRVLILVSLLASVVAQAENIQMAPDMVELIVDTNHQAQGFLARNHNYQVQFDVDPLVNGRINLGFQLRLNKFLALDIPVSYDSSGFGQWGGRMMKIYPEDLSQWSVMGGVGLKIRLSEWLGKGSFYFEPLLQVGYYSQTMRSNTSTNSIRIRPGLYLGYEEIFDTGFVVGAKLGVERPFDIGSLTVSTGFSVVPMLAIGYAW